MAGAVEEAGKAVGGFMTAMGTQPLALALVVGNFALLALVFYQGASITGQRKETTDLIVGWQKETDKLMVNCVSAEVSRNMMDNMQKITETMLSAEQKEIQRMQEAINSERNRSFELRQREQKELDELKQQQQRQQQQQPQQQQPQDAPPRMQRLSTHSAFFPLPPVSSAAPDWINQRMR